MSLAGESTHFSQGQTVTQSEWRAALHTAAAAGGGGGGGSFTWGTGLIVVK